MAKHGNLGYLLWVVDVSGLIMPPPRESILPPAKRIFVGREAELRLFKKAAFAISADRASLLVFHGVGGQGKTALCRELMRQTENEPSYFFLRRALLDLHERPKTDPDLLLVWIRNEFAKSGLLMPRFDLALALIWESTRSEEPFPNLTKPLIYRDTIAAGEDASDAFKWLKSEEAITLFGEVAGEIPGLGFLLKRIGNWTIDSSKRAYLAHTRNALKCLYDGNGALKPPHELSALLPWILAQDLNHHLAENANERLVLFVDGYERVFDQGGAGVRWVENPFDRHMRRLIQETNGLLAVFFSRERLPWSDDLDWSADLDGNQHPLGGLVDAEANAFLRSVPINDVAIRRVIIEGAREYADLKAPIYPLMLDLQIDHWRVLTAHKQATEEQFTVHAKTFEVRCIELIERVLRDYGEPLQNTIERLSVAQRFDRAAFDYVVRTFDTHLPAGSFDRIATLSFVTRASGDFLSMHNVIAAAIRERLEPATRSGSIEALFRHFSERAQVKTHFELKDAHVLALFEAAYLRRMQGAEGYVGWLASATELMHLAARYGQASALWRDAITFVEEALGADHPDTATSLNFLGGLFLTQGDYAQAKPLYERALAIRKTTLGPEHPDTAQSLNNLSGLLYDMGNYGPAESFLVQAIAIFHNLLGPEHPDTASSLSNLAFLLNAQGKYAKAKLYFEQALSIRKKTLGTEHPDTAKSLDNLAVLLNAQGDYELAKPLFVRALAILENSLGPKHPNTARSLNNLAVLLTAQGDFVGAKQLFDRALIIRESFLGRDHPETAQSLNNLAFMMYEMGDLDGSEPLFLRALEIRKNRLGIEHPDTATSFHNIGVLFMKKNKDAEARPYIEQALKIRTKTLGEKHPDTNISAKNLIHILWPAGDQIGTKKFRERASDAYSAFENFDMGELPSNIQYSTHTRSSSLLPQYEAVENFSYGLEITSFDRSSSSNSERIEILKQATEIFGSEENAKNWLRNPAMWLNHQRPIDLLETSKGIDIVRTYLNRIARGVYT